jgi:PIN domain nuclease of toxin-antitoxin system
VILLDAYALIALTVAEAASADVERLLRQETCAMSTVNLAEAIDVLQRARSLPADLVRSAIEPLFLGVVATVSPPAATAWIAADIRTRYYDRRLRALSLADCFLIAHASEAAAVATADPAIADVARAEGIELVALPDTSGATP